MGTILITGGAKRIGAEISLHLAKSGYSIAIHYNHSHKEAENLAKKIRHHKVHCEIFHTDLTNSEEVTALIPAVQKKFTNLQCLINCASIFENSNLLTENLPDFNRHFTINLRAPFILSSQFAKHIKKGQIINILDTNIVKNKTAHLSYILAKKSLADLTSLSAVELAPNIRVNAVAPGLILPPDDKKSDYLDRLAKHIPLKRKGEPADIAKAVQFLLENTYITGQTIFVDGGEHLI